MQKLIFVLATACLFACGSASQTGPKTTNPPLTDAQKNGGDKNDAKDKTTPPAEETGVDVGGKTLQFAKIGFQITMTKGAWKGQIVKRDQGLRILLLRPDLKALLLLIPIGAEDTDTAQSIAEDQHQQAVKEPSMKKVSAVVAEANGRYAWIGERTEDGQDFQTYLAVQPHPTIPHAFIGAVVQVPSDKADAFIKEVKTCLDTIAALP